MKKLMILGGSRYLIPVIESAHKHDIYVITADYLPDNIAHSYADEYCNVSLIDKDAVLEEAKKRNIDGIISFACDPGVVTAAYVAEKMGLPFQTSYEAACILQDKGLFRQFLIDNGFNCPFAKRYTDRNEAKKDRDLFKWPVIVKPVDSAGSKGVTRVDEFEDLDSAIDAAIAESHCGAFIIEEFIIFDGHHSSTDPITVDGELKFITFSDQLFDPEAENPYTPSLIIWPSTMAQKHQDTLASEIQRLMHLLKTRTGIYNIESCVGIDGKPYIMEVSPRGGGCKICDLQKLAYGVDLIEAEVLKAVGLPIGEINAGECDGHWCEAVIHAAPGESGILKKITIDPEVKDYVKVIDTYMKEGDMVHEFTGANMSLGDIFLRFDTREQLDEVVGRMREWLHIELE